MDQHIISNVSSNNNEDDNLNEELSNTKLLKRITVKLGNNDP